MALVKVINGALRFVEPWTQSPSRNGAAKLNLLRVINYSPAGPLVVSINKRPVLAPTSTNLMARVGSRMGLWAYSNLDPASFHVSLIICASGPFHKRLHAAVAAVRFVGRMQAHASPAWSLTLAALLFARLA